MPTRFLHGFDLNASLLRDQLKWLAGVSSIRISSQHFRQVQVHRRNRTFRFLLNICELLHRIRLPGERTGAMQDPLLRSILRDEIILDCKFYKNALTGGLMQEKVSGGHLFQLLSYLRNARKTFSDWSEGPLPRGILLYPAVQRPFDFRYELVGYNIRVCTVDLDRPWHQIRDGLLQVICPKKEA